MHRRHTQNLGPLLLAQLRADHTIDTGPDGLARLVDEHAGIVVKLDHGPVLALGAVPRAHHHGVPDVAAFHLVGRRGRRHALTGGGALLLHDADDAVADAGVALLPCDLGAFDEGGAGVVDAVEDCLDRDGGRGDVRLSPALGKGEEEEEGKKES